MSADANAVLSVDVAVVGGGLVGAVAALGLARQGRQVALVERSAPARTLGLLGHDLRTVALAPAARRLMDQVGLREQATGAPYRGMRIWDSRGTAVLEFDAAEVGRSELGWILENSPTLEQIWQALVREPNLTLLCPATVSGVRDRGCTIALELGSKVVEARLVVAADGAQSQVRQLLGVSVAEHDTGHHALATVVRTEAAHEAIARQCFQPEGPVALLPLEEPQLCSVVWSQPPAAAARRIALDEGEFRSELARATGGCLGAILDSDRRLAFPLRQLLAGRFNPVPRVVLLGDAAHVLHPLAGLGANLGFEDVAAMLELLAGLRLAADPGSPGLWATYARQRHARAALMLRLMSGLKTLYAGSGPFGQLLRNGGVHWLNRSQSIKQQVIMEAMGLGAFAVGSLRGGPAPAV